MRKFTTGHYTYDPTNEPTAHRNWYIRPSVTGAHTVMCYHDDRTREWKLCVMLNLVLLQATTDVLPLTLALYLYPQPLGPVPALRGCPR